MNKQLQFYKAEYNDRTIYYYYTESNIFVSRKCYLSAFFILFGIIFICFKVPSWVLYGVEKNFFNFLDLFLVLLWLFLIRFNFKNLQTYSNHVQLLKKVRIEYKDGNISELTNF